jgi:hypothetical protein
MILGKWLETREVGGEDVDVGDGIKWIKLFESFGQMRNVSFVLGRVYTLDCASSTSFFRSDLGSEQF